MLKRKKPDPNSAKMKAAGRAYTEQVKNAKPWLDKYLASKDSQNNSAPIDPIQPQIATSPILKPEKDYKALYESALVRITELEKKLRKRTAKKDDKRPAGFGRGPKSILPGGQPANATPKPKRHFSRKTNPYWD